MKKLWVTLNPPKRRAFYATTWSVPNVKDVSRGVALVQSGEGSGREILLSPERYFDGYEEEHCTICANNQEPVSTKEFSERVRDVSKRPGVAGVFVRFYEYEDALEDETCRIGSDSVYVVTPAQPSEVRKWSDDFEPPRLAALPRRS